MEDTSHSAPAGTWPAVREPLHLLACVLLLAGPVILSFFSGGYFDEARAWAGLVAWGLAAAALVLSASISLRSRPAVLAIGALALFAAWTLLSMIWAPVTGRAYHAGQLAMLYLGALIAAALLLTGRARTRLVEPGLAAGATLVVSYGLSERMLPGLLHFQRSLAAQGRLNQPLTYWNAMGELAAIGLVLGVRLAGDASRPRWLRALGAASIAPLGMGLYLSFSRGALFACAAGLIALIAAAPRREQLQAIGLGLLTGALTAVVAAPMKGVTSLGGGAGTRERQGALALALLIAIALAAAALQTLTASRGRTGPVALPRHHALLALILICLGLAAAIVLGAKESSTAPLGTGASRLVTLQSNRYNYWRVALRAFAAEPLRGAGAGSWEIWWLRYRPNGEFAQDAHSLFLQTVAELGIVGLALLSVFLAGVALAARTAHRLDWALAAGPIAGAVTWLAHAPLDWDWQLPALSLFAFALGGLLLALAREAQLRPNRLDSHSFPAVQGAPRSASMSA